MTTRTAFQAPVLRSVRLALAVGVVAATSLTACSFEVVRTDDATSAPAAEAPVDSSDVDTSDSSDTSDTTDTSDYDDSSDTSDSDTSSDDTSSEDTDTSDSDTDTSSDSGSDSDMPLDGYDPLVDRSTWTPETEALCVDGVATIHEPGVWEVTTDCDTVDVQGDGAVVLTQSIDILELNATGALVITTSVREINYWGDGSVVGYEDNGPETEYLGGDGNIAFRIW